MTIQEIADELYRLYGSSCLDDQTERENVARYIHGLVEAANGERTANDDEFDEFPVLVRIPKEDFARCIDIEDAILEDFPDAELVFLPERPFKAGS